jgi:hypothetical protein
LRVGAGCCAQRKRIAAAAHVLARWHEVLDGRGCAWQCGGVLCTAQQVRCCARGRGAGASGCCAQRKRSAALPHVAPCFYDAMEAHRRERRSGGVLCAAQQVRCCACERGAGAAGCCAQRQRSSASPHTLPRCHEVLDGRGCTWYCAAACGVTRRRARRQRVRV